MKKLILLATAACIFIFNSCNTKKGENRAGMTEKASKNLASMKGIVECFNKKDFSNLGDYVAENCIDHYGETDLKGLAQMKAEYEKWIGMSENTPVRAKLELANDEYVVMWISFEETMKVDAMGMKKGQVFKKTDMEVARFENGKAVEHWTFMDPAIVMQMMQPATKDTSKAKQ